MLCSANARTQSVVCVCVCALCFCVYCKIRQKAIVAKSQWARARSHTPNGCSVLICMDGYYVWNVLTCRWFDVTVFLWCCVHQCSTTLCRTDPLLNLKCNYGNMTTLFFLYSEFPFFVISQWCLHFCYYRYRCRRLCVRLCYCFLVHFFYAIPFLF